MIVQSINDLVIELVPNSFRADFTCALCGTTKYCKYKVINRKTKEARYYCNMCYLHVAADIIKANKILNDPFFQIPDKEEFFNGEA